jgi:glycerophosphoryl diester phosphodiesterase
MRLSALTLLVVDEAVNHDTLQVHPYTFRNENQYLHFDFHQDPYAEYEYWLNEIGVDGLFTDFTGSLHKYQEWTTPYQKEKNPEALLREIANMLKNDGY